VDGPPPQIVLCLDINASSNQALDLCDVASVNAFISKFIIPVVMERTRMNGRLSAKRSPCSET
jgi:hypothetical protein